MGFKFFKVIVLIFWFIPVQFPDEKGEAGLMPDFPDLAQKVKDAQRHEGFLNLYSKDGALYALVPEDFLGQEFFFFSSLSRGNYGGILSPEMMLDQEILFFDKNEKRLGLYQRDLYHHVAETGPYKDAVDKAYPPSLVQSFPILAAEKKTRAYLIRLDPFLFSKGNGILPAWVLQFIGIEEVQPENSYITRTRVQPSSLEIEIQSTLKLEPYLRSIHQANQFRLRFSFVRKKESSYKRRIADDRIGYFTVGHKSFSNPDSESSEHRYIRRWNLVKAAPGEKPSIVKQPIIFYLDPTIPHKYRESVRAGVLEWNVAFEKMGFIGALEVRQVDSEKSWDPLDMEKSTISWTADSYPFAIGPSRINPETGEILDADLIVSSGMASFIEETADLLFPESGSLLAEQLKSEESKEEEFIQVWEEKMKVPHHLREISGICSYPQFLSAGKYLALKSMEATVGVSGIEIGIWKEKFVGTYLKHIVMHEVGHALGLRHNFKASSIKPYEELLDPEVNQRLQPSSSVMDYNDVFISKDPKLQGKYLNDALGAYDFLAIKYGYSSLPPQEEQTALLRLAASLQEQGLVYGTDEDKWFSVDPMIAPNDLSDNLPQAASDKLELFEGLLENIDEKILKEGDRYDSVRKILFRILNEHLFKTLQITRVIGGVSTSRVHASLNHGRLPFEPFSKKAHEEALAYFESRVFSENWLKVSPQILAMARWSPWDVGSGSPVSLDWIHRVLQILTIYYVLDGGVLNRIRTFHEKYDQDAYPAVRILDKFREFIFEPWKKSGRLPDLVVSIFFIKHLGITLQDESTVPTMVKLKALSILSELKGWLTQAILAKSNVPQVFTIQVAHKRDLAADANKRMAKLLVDKINQVLEGRRRIQE